MEARVVLHEMRCGSGITRAASEKTDDQCRHDVTCAQAHRGDCEARRLKWGQKQSNGAAGAPRVPQTSGAEKGAHLERAYDKRCWAKGLRQASQAKNKLLASPSDKVGANHPPMTVTAAAICTRGEMQTGVRKGRARSTRSLMRWSEMRWELRPVSLGHVDWLGAHQHDHAREVSVLHRRCLRTYANTARRRRQKRNASA